MTFRHDNYRSGLDPTESVLTLQNVNSTDFGLRAWLKVDDRVDAQPLYLSNLTINGATHNVVFVATENDSVYAFDSDTGAQLWQVSLVGSGESSATPPADCQYVSPHMGVTATPVIDRSAGAHGVLYVVSVSQDASGQDHQRLHALDVTTGAELMGGPTEISASYPTSNDGTTTFDPNQYIERAALLLDNGTIYTTWASHCDGNPYSGWVIAYSESTLQQTGVLNLGPGIGVSPSNYPIGPAIWMSGDGPAADADHNVYLLSANGPFDTSLVNGFPSLGDYGNSFVKISTTGGNLAVADYFTESNELAESTSDEDLGSGGEMLVDVADASGTVHNLMVGAGKDGNIYVVDRNSMGHFNASSDNIYQEIDGAFAEGAPYSVFSTPAYFNGTVYYGDRNGTLKAYAFSNGKLGTSPTSQTAETFGYPGAQPVVSSNGTSNAIVWAWENTNPDAPSPQPPAVLHAYDASNLANELYNSNQAANGRDQLGLGTAHYFMTPAVADGKVFVGTPNDEVAVFGLLN